MSISKHYEWQDNNRRREFETWEQEIEHVKSLGYSLVPPTYHIPHWSMDFSPGAKVPKIYVLRNDGMDEMRSRFDCKASRLGYPIFFKDEESPPTEADLAKELEAMRTSRDWYKKRCEMLGEVQKHMRDPERTLVCDILANGMLLPDSKGERYGFVPERKHT